MFYVGQKVVCVDNLPHGRAISWGASDAPAVGEIYTVLKAYVWKGKELVWLKEIRRSDLARELYGPDVGYGAFRFRPVVERKTDISIFQQMLTPTKREFAQ